MRYLPVQPSILSKLAIALTISTVSLPGLALKSRTTTERDLGTAIDDLLSRTFKSDRPGAAVIAMKDGRVVFRKGYGLANLELGVQIQPDMVFRLASMTKQFTAVAILMLVEQGKLALNDDITRFLPDYGTKGHRIDVEHLLTHTAGVPNYSFADLPEGGRKDLTLNELIALFKDKPLDFAPGERWSYSNSGYALLAAIIEKVSGQSYQDFIEQRIFAALGMKHSYYDRPDRIIPGRVQGYTETEKGYANGAYFSMTVPNAAGSLMSSADDLALWDASLYGQNLVKQELLKRGWTSFKLNSGKPTHYGYGWSIGSYEGHKAISHDGGITGFTTAAVRMPDAKVYVAVLANHRPEPSPEQLAFQIAAILIGRPYQTPVAIELPANALDRYVGVYEPTDGPAATVEKEGNRLFLTMGRKREILPLSELEFFQQNSMNRITFVKGADGHISGFVYRLLRGAETEATKKR